MSPGSVEVVVIDLRSLNEDYERLVYEGWVHRFLAPDEINRWRSWIRKRARAEKLGVRTSGRVLEGWQLKQRFAVRGRDDLGGNTATVSAVRADLEAYRAALDSKSEDAT
jgi:hypothetical protein